MCVRARQTCCFFLLFFGLFSRAPPRGGASDPLGLQPAPPLFSPLQ